MTRRWLIRICFMLPILLCVGGWVWGFARYDYVIRFHDNNYFVEVGSGTGAICIRQGGDMRADASHPEAWLCGERESDPRFWPTQAPTDVLDFSGFHAWGLSIGKAHERWRGVVYILMVPDWLLLIVFSAALLFVWRRTRPRQPGRAFPVELAKPI